VGGGGCEQREGEEERGRSEGGRGREGEGGEGRARDGRMGEGGEGGVTMFGHAPGTVGSGPHGGINVQKPEDALRVKASCCVASGAVTSLQKCSPSIDWDLHFPLQNL
jgi:hypothetical protein